MSCRSSQQPEASSQQPVVLYMQSPSSLAWAQRTLHLILHHHSCSYEDLAIVVGKNETSPDLMPGPNISSLGEMLACAAIVRPSYHHISESTSQASVHFITEAAAVPGSTQRSAPGLPGRRTCKLEMHRSIRRSIVGSHEEGLLPCHCLRSSSRAMPDPKPVLWPRSAY